MSDDPDTPTVIPLPVADEISEVVYPVPPELLVWEETNLPEPPPEEPVP